MSNDYFGSQPSGPQPSGVPGPGPQGQPSGMYEASPYRYAPPAGWQAPTQPLPVHAPVPEKPKRGGAKVAGLVLGVALLSAAAGGFAGAAAGSNTRPQQQQVVTQQGETVTKVVQGNSSAPDWTATAAAVAPSVVSILVSTGQGQGQGSGVVWDTKGNIVTNNHVVAAAGKGGEVRIGLGDGMYDATVRGLDPSTDLAVVTLNKPPKDLRAMAVAKDQPKVGAPVMAVGNPLGLANTVTTGIVSALNRPVTTQQQSSDPREGSVPVVTNAIQTSAPINPGNSGGALVNASGELVGINSSIASVGSSGGEAGNIGIGFAIPSALVDNVAGQLISSGKVDHAFLGVKSETTIVKQKDGSQRMGARVREVVQDTPAEKAGLREGDVITQLDGTSVVSTDSLIGMIRAAKPDQEVTLTYVRDGEQKTAKLRLTTTKQ